LLALSDRAVSILENWALSKKGLADLLLWMATRGRLPPAGRPYNKLLVVMKDGTIYKQ
jgi:imidazolonepropionase-like amidohydrolase